MVDKIMNILNKLKFIHCLFLPTVVVVVWWVVGLPLLLFPQLGYSTLYNNVSLVVVVIVGVIIIAIDIYLFKKRQYRNAVAIIIGIPVAFVIAVISLILLFGFGGVMT